MVVFRAVWRIDSSQMRPTQESVVSFVYLPFSPLCQCTSLWTEQFVGGTRCLSPSLETNILNQECSHNPIEVDLSAQAKLLETFMTGVKLQEKILLFGPLRKVDLVYLLSSPGQAVKLAIGGL